MTPSEALGNVKEIAAILRDSWNATELADTLEESIIVLISAAKTDNHYEFAVPGLAPEPNFSEIVKDAAVKFSV